TQIHGFRAPYLSTSKALYATLAEHGFAYDASGVSRGPAKPAQSDGMAHFALPQIPEGPSERRVIAMDYNLFVRHSGGFEKADDDAVF
ncbi:polysaccharide deacetylase, partial [Rhizobiaceae sp. 2RAB30]